MDKINPGDEFYHKATLLRCVVISTSESMVKVRDEKNQEQDYFPQELETEAEVDARYDAGSREIEESDLGFGY